MDTRLRSLAIPFVAGLALFACSSDGEQVADIIKDRATDVLDLDDPTVTCPDDAEAGEGNTFDCTVDVEGQELTVGVTFTSDTEFDMVPNEAVFATDDVESVLADYATEQVGLTIAFDCPGDANTVIPLDDTIECPGEADDGSTGTGVIGVGADGSLEPRDLIPD